MSDDVTVREATEDDIEQVRDIFLEVYAGDYPFEGFTDPRWLKRSVFNDEIAMLVAVDEGTGEILGTSSVVFDLGAHSDLLAEFGRLAVKPSARGRGVGGRLMRARVDAIRFRVHAAIAQNRCTHPYSQRISLTHGFAAVGFLPMKYKFDHRESISLWMRHFGPALSLRRNNPRIVPEAHALASVALEGCGLPVDGIVDEESAPYAAATARQQAIEELNARGLPALLRIERGRVRNRELFGPMRLHYGYFQLTARHATYLVARDPSSREISGAIGYLHDEDNAAAHVFELITREAGISRQLLEAFLGRCHDWGVEYVEVDVSAHAPRMQRTLLELGFLPAAYLPAMVFHDVERLDVIKMVRLLCDLDVGALDLIPTSQVMADLVVRQFAAQRVLPRVASAIGRVRLFEGLTDEQTARVAGVCGVREYPAGQALMRPADPSEAILVILDGRCRVHVDGREVGHVGAGETLGEAAVVLDEPHGSEVVAESALTAAILSRADLQELTRLRPDIAVILYRNLARGLGRKLRRSDRAISPAGSGETT